MAIRSAPRPAGAGGGGPLDLPVLSVKEAAFMTRGLCSDRSPWGPAFPAPHRALQVPPPPQAVTEPLGFCSHWSPWQASGTKDTDRRRSVFVG